jgi:hypothetical protein
LGLVGVEPPQAAAMATPPIARNRARDILSVQGVEGRGASLAPRLQRTEIVLEGSPARRNAPDSLGDERRAHRTHMWAAVGSASNHRPSRSIPASAGRGLSHMSKTHSSRPASAARAPDRRDTPRTAHTSPSAWCPSFPFRSVDSGSWPQSLALPWVESTAASAIEARVQLLITMHEGITICPAVPAWPSTSHLDIIELGDGIR